MSRIALIFVFFLIISNSATYAKEKDSDSFDMKEFIFHHVGDAYHLDAFGFHIPLPVIVISNGKLLTFMSNAFGGDEEGKVIVENKE